MNKKLTALALISSLVANSASAGITGALDSMFLSNTTAPSGISTADRAGYMFGGAAIHIPVQNINLISFDPPRFNAGCGGIDLYLGSFSFINAQQLVALFKQIVASAASALFYAAIQSISPSLADIMSKFQKIVGDLNNLFRNTCQMGSVATGNSNFGNALSTLTSDSTTMIGQAKSLFSDYSSGETSTPSTMANDNSQSNPPAGAGVNPSMSSVPANPLIGNFIWKIFSVTAPENNMAQAAGTPATGNNVTIREFLMSFSGTKINAPGNAATSNCGATNPNSAPSGTVGGGGAVNSPGTFEPTLSFNDLLNGSGASSSGKQVPKLILGCTDDGGGTIMPDSNTGCMVIDCSRQWNFEGTYSMVKKFLFGTPTGGADVTNSLGETLPNGPAGLDNTVYSNGIIYKITHCPTAGITSVTTTTTAPTCSMSATELSFLQNAGGPLQSLIMRLQQMGDTDGGVSRGAVFADLVDVFANDYAIQLANAIYSAINVGISGSAVQAANIPESVTRAQEKLAADIRAADAKTALGRKRIETVQKEIDEMLKNNPNAVSVGF